LTDIHYSGTKEQAKALFVNAELNESAVIHCADGDLPASEL